jgi:hypothetical protein
VALETAGNGTPRDWNYNFHANLVRTDGRRVTDSPTVKFEVRLNNLANSVSISTDVDVPQGKQVVVGKATSGDRAYILVVSAKVLN